MMRFAFIGGKHTGPADEISAMVFMVTVMMPRMMLMMGRAVMDSGVGVGRTINENRGQQTKQDKFLHDIGLNSNRRNCR